MPKTAGGNRPPDPTTHGHTAGLRHSPTYSSWCHMVNRCTNPRNDSWDSYGGRGIRVCDRWRKFENFLADMGERTAGLTIERLDNEGHYEPSNCKWATRKEQQNNRRKPRLGPESRGEKHHLSKLTEEDVRKIRALQNRDQRRIAEQFGVSQSTVWSIMNRKTWTHV